MPYYRITILLKNKPMAQGIRHFDNANIDAVTNIARVFARRHYGEHQVVDVEAAMLSNHATAVKQYIATQQKKRDAGRMGGISPASMHGSRKAGFKKDAPSMGERNK